MGLPQNAIPFDINPYQVTGANPTTHFEQIYSRALVALNNAVVAFDAAANVTQVLRAGNDDQASFQQSVDAQELAFTNQLVGIYGTPYPDDEGPGQTYAQGYNGPDLIHYMYVDRPDQTVYGSSLTNVQTFKVNTTQLPSDWQSVLYSDVSFVTNANSPSYANYIEFQIGPDGFFDKPANWNSERASPGSIQQAIAAYILAHDALDAALQDAVNVKLAFDKAIQVFEAQVAEHNTKTTIQDIDAALADTYNAAQAADNIYDKLQGVTKDILTQAGMALKEAIPQSIIVGLADGGDTLAPARAAVETAGNSAVAAVEGATAAADAVTQALKTTVDLQTSVNNLLIAGMDWDLQVQQSVNNLGNQLTAVQGHITTINARLFDLSNAKMKYEQLVAQGEALQEQRQTFREKAAAIIQGYRVRDAAFRLFQNEDLQRYQSLFNLAAQYAFMAAQAYDYETGLLNTDAGKAFVSQIVSAQALGVITGGLPQFTGSDTGGDPGLSSALAAMFADWSVLKGRLGFNNPDGYSTTVSLRGENYRILPGADGKNNWQDVLQQGRVPDLLADSDVRRYCMQIDDGSGLPVPGIILTFSTVIADGLNLFGQPLAAGDHDFSSSSFATKIFSVGVDFDGYIGMDNPTGAAATNTLDPNALAATPYVYLIPVGVDSMRTPPLGDTAAVRTWSVDDVAIPLPFNISASDFSTTAFYQSGDSLSEPLYQIRKHQAFRPVSTTTAFSTSIYGGNSLSRSQFSNSRLIGRSIWNSKWKLVIPGKTLLNDPNQGLNRFIQTVSDVKFFFVTYSYSGN